MHSPAQLRRWHPGPGVVLDGADDRDGWTFYRYVDGAAQVNLAAFLAARSDTVRLIRDLLSATVSRTAHLDCFGLHEWAMVYRETPEPPDPGLLRPRTRDQRAGYEGRSV